MSSKLTNQSLYSVSGDAVNTPLAGAPQFKERRPPTRTVISGDVKRSKLARSTKCSSKDWNNLTPAFW